MSPTQASEPPTAPATSASSRIGAVVWAASIAVLAALVGWIFRHHISGEYSFTFDFPMTYYAMTHYWIASVQHGEWPHWIPYQSMGYPSAMNPQMGLFYPPLWIFVLLRIPYTIHAANVFQVLHIFFGSVGALLLLARLSGSRAAGLCGAVAFIFFGGFYTNAQHPDIVRAFTWIPWLLWSAMLDGDVRTVRVAGLRWRTRLAGRNLLAPAFLACFITGAYPGLMISGLLSFAIFAAAEAARRDSAAWRDCAAQVGMMAVALAMAAAFLLPSVYMSRGTVRAQVASQLQRVYVGPADLWQFLYPSPTVAAHDYSMHGMQVPAVLLIFAAALSVRQFRKLLPFGAIAAFAALMCLDLFRPVSTLIVTAVPILGLSRFPAGDYRLFVSFFAMAAGTVGLANVMSSIRIWRAAALMSAIVAAIAWQALRYVRAPLVPAMSGEFARFATNTVLACAGIIVLVVVAARVRRAAVIPFAVLPAIVFTMFPVIRSEAMYWGDPNFVALVYDRQGLPLRLEETSRTDALFGRDARERPARTATKTLLDLSWRGYIDGTYMMSDLSGVVSGSRRAIETNPPLIDFMRRSSTVTAISCAQTTSCSTAGPAEVSVTAAAAPAGEPLRYGRNSVEYRVHVPDRSLVVENETYAEGWNGRCETHGETIPVRVVDGGLRGWVVDAGEHRIQLLYRTPLLATGAAVSAAAALLWAVVLWLWRGARVTSALA